MFYYNKKILYSGVGFERQKVKHFLGVLPVFDRLCCDFFRFDSFASTEETFVFLLEFVAFRFFRCTTVIVFGAG